MNSLDRSCSNTAGTTFKNIGVMVAHNAPENDKNRSFDYESWELLTVSGLWKMCVAKDLGGEGRPWTDFVAAVKNLASTSEDTGFLISVLGHVGAIKALTSYGTQQQIEKWLPTLLEGQIAITAMTEATGGSDLARMQFGASKSDSGWRLNGSKCHITNAPIAKLGLIAGKIPELGKGRDITLFFTELDKKGIARSELEDNLGIRTSPTCDLAFDNVVCDEVNILGKPGDGLSILYEIIAFERALYGPVAAGLISSMLRRTMERTEQRVAFGKPIADYQYVQGRITAMKAAEVTCTALSVDAMADLEAGKAEASIKCSVTKLQAGEAVHLAAENMVQLFGHLGFMSGDVSRFMRDAVGIRIAGGTSDIQRINIFNQMRRIRSYAQNQLFDLPVKANRSACNTCNEKMNEPTPAE